MAAISNNAFTSGFASGALGLAGGETGAADAPASAPARGSGAPGLGGWTPLPEPPRLDPGAGAAAGSDPAATFTSVMNELTAALSNVLARLGSLLGGAAGTAGSASAQTAFENASASSVGDPHDALAGTTAAGASVDAKWDDMHARVDLLDSDSFAGGYRVATTVTPPDAKGRAYNARASVVTGGGRTSVELARDGSYAVVANGAAVALQPGRTVPLGDGESVKLNADGSLSIEDANRSGGSIATTLAVRGEGVDVSTSAYGVDLGGYLVERGRTGGS